MATAAKIAIQLEAQTATLQKGFAEASGAIRNLDQNMAGSVAKGMAIFNAGLFAAQQALGALKGAIAGVLASMQELDQAAKFAARVGASADQLTALGFAAEQSGASQQELFTALEKLQKKISEAAAGTGEARAAFEELGVSASDLASLPVDQQFAVISDALNNVGSSSDKTRLAMKLFEEAGGKLIPLMSAGSAGLNAFGQEAENLGLLLGDARGGVEAANDAINRMKRAWGALVQQVAVAVAPALEAIANALAKVVGLFNRLIGRASGASGTFEEFRRTTVSARRAIEETAEATDKATKKSAAAIERGIKRSRAALDPGVGEYATPAVGAVTRRSAEGFSALQAALRQREDEERRHREILLWFARLVTAVRSGVVELEPVSL